MAKKHNEPMDLAVGPVFLSDITVKGGPKISFFPSFQSLTVSFCDFPCVCVEGGVKKMKTRKPANE